MNRDRIFAFRHKVLVHLLSGVLPYYVVNEFPKCGGSWLTEMLADALDLPFRRNEPVRVEKALVHGHFLRPGLLRNVVVLWRDPRDVLVSLYHHCFFISEYADQLFGNGKLVAGMRQALPFADYDDVAANLPAFIAYIHENPVVPRFTWPDFARQWAERDVVHTSYEALRADTPEELARVVGALAGVSLDNARATMIAERHSFARAKAKSEQNLAPEARPFVRSGSVGGWRAQFGPEAEALLDRHGYRPLMERLGYTL